MNATRQFLRIGLLVLALGAANGTARAQVLAIWNGGSGSWSNASNWTCSPAPPQCVPNGAGAGVIAKGGAINLDINVSIGSFQDLGTTELTLNGSSMATTGGLTVNGGLQLTNATVNTPLSSKSIILGGGSSSWLTSTVNGQGLLLDGSLDTNLTELNTLSGFIGNRGSGTMSIASTTWNTDTIALGANAGTSGQLTLGGLSFLNLGNVGVLGTTGGIAVGGEGQGILNINGGVIKSLTPSFISVGTNPTGGAGNGQMTITNGGIVTVSSVLVGFSGPGTTATLTIDGEGSQLNIDGQIPGAGVGVGGGTVTVSNGASVSGGNLIVSQGQVTLDSGATWTVTGPGNQPDVTVGSFARASGPFAGSTGVASLSVQGGASGSNETSILIGANAGADGTMTITGDGSKWDSTGAVVVGVGGAGTLNVQEGGVLTSGPGTFQFAPVDTSVSGSIGQLAGSVGAVTITGDDSKWEANGNVQVGAAGTGTLNIQDQAEMSANNLSVGSLAGGAGTVSMTGGTLTLSGDLVVGDAGTGTLTVVPNAPDDEGDITSKNGIIGAQAGSNGSVVIGSAVGQGMQATSSNWMIQNNLIVAQAGSGSLDIGGNVTNLSASIGQQATGVGLVTVENGGMWTTTNNLIIGDQGTGNLTINSGGFANVSVGAVTIANQLGSKGTVDVQGQFNMTQNLTIGAGGAGTMTIENGGAVASGSAQIAANPLSTGTVTVTGAKSSWGVDGTLFVGQGGTGTLTVSNGGQVLSRDGFVGQQSGSVGTATITGSGSLWSATLPGGTGTISVGGNGSQGTLIVQNGGEVEANSVVVNTGGTLNGQGGSIVANLTNAGGIITPGDATGLMSVTGNFLQNSGSTLFEIDGGGPGQFDQLLVSGNVAFDGGTLDINFGAGFDPTKGESFDLISALALSNLGVTVDITGLPSGFVFADEFSSTGFDLLTEKTPTSGTGGGTGGSPAPEPGTILLFATGLLGLACCRIRSRLRGANR